MRSRVAELRRIAMGIAKELGLTEEAVAKVGIVATESATNLVKHAQGGEILYRTSHCRDTPGWKFWLLTGGRVWEMPSNAWRTATLQQELRAPDWCTLTFGERVHAYSQPGRGTVMVARVHELAGTTAGYVRRSNRAFSGRARVRRCVVDTPDRSHGATVGGGRAGTRSAGGGCGWRGDPRVLKLRAESPGEMVERLHESLRGTRGAALAVARIDRQADACSTQEWGILRARW